MDTLTPEVRALIKDIRKDSPELDDFSDLFIAAVHKSLAKAGKSISSYKPITLTSTDSDQIRQTFESVRKTVSSIAEHTLIIPSYWSTAEVIAATGLEIFGADAISYFRNARSLGHVLSRFYQPLGLERSPVKEHNRWKYRIKPTEETNNAKNIIS